MWTPGARRRRTEVYSKEGEEAAAAAEEEEDLLTIDDRVYCSKHLRAAFAAHIHRTPATVNGERGNGPFQPCTLNPTLDF